ncbi:hypothetical protein PAHAL_9G604300 [Panicum hallii]|uniref:Uncharacterized protein n=1 Tax=Panicum hallii TaxID=206008 RepID=A0A2S3IV95_9POAL|nr:hypothetical protein PAHAL_9G604300 [Panicum hallii]
MPRRFHRLISPPAGRQGEHGRPVPEPRRRRPSPRRQPPPPPQLTPRRESCDPHLTGARPTRRALDHPPRSPRRTQQQAITCAAPAALLSSPPPGRRAGRSERLQAGVASRRVLPLLGTNGNPSPPSRPSSAGRGPAPPPSRFLVSIPSAARPAPEPTHLSSRFPTRAARSAPAALCPRTQKSLFGRLARVFFCVFRAMSYPLVPA